MRSLVTGIAGFAAGHLARLLAANGEEVCGVDLAGTSLAHLGDLGRRVPLIHGSLDEPGVAEAAFGEFAPQRVYHLAGLARVAESWGAREQTIRSNFMAAFRLLEAARQAAGAGRPARLLLAGSGEQYGLVPEAGQPIAEDRPLRPRSPYAAAKCAQEALGCQYALGEHLEVLLVRPFNHIGPGQRAGFVSADFAGQIARIELGLQAPLIRVGNLEARRDFCDVGDMVEGYRAVMERGRPGEVYNLCSGRALAVSELLARLLERARVPIDVQVDPARFRPADIPLLVGDPGRARRELDWQARRPIEETLDKILDSWRTRARSAPAEGERS